MGVTEPAKVTISNRLGSSTKTFKNLTFKGGRPEKRLFGVPVIQFKNFKNLNRREFNSGIVKVTSFQIIRFHRM
jgi:hypothetical protein